MPCGTPGDSAFTGGLSTVMTPTPPTVSYFTNSRSPSAIFLSSLRRFHNETARQRELGELQSMSLLMPSFSTGALKVSQRRVLTPLNRMVCEHLCLMDWQQPLR